jgi:hypothetical protein
MSLILGFFIGFVFYCASSPKQDANPHRSCIIPVPYTTKAVHIHHWLYLLLILPILWFKFNNYFLSGFCIGGIVQSFIWYSDSMVFIVKRERSLFHDFVL